MDRRTFLASSITGAALLTTQQYTSAQTESPVTANPLGDPIGRIPVRASADIASSPLSVGFEALDRRGFDPQKTYPHLAKLGVKWARCQTGWGRCETKRGQYDFSWLDEVVDALLEIGIQPWFNLGYGNRLYTVGAIDEAAAGFTPVYDEAAMLGWLKYVGSLTRHFNGRVKHYEIWNEPNHSGFWRPRDPNASDYMKLVSRTAPVIRAELPDAVIIGGACDGVSLDFIGLCFREDMGEYIDVVSFHPYRAIPEAGYADEVSRLRRLLAKHDSTCPLWQGENGCPSVGGSGSVGALSDLAWNETTQAKWLLRRIITDLKHELALTSYFHAVDLVGYRGETNYKGLLRGDEYTPKPAYFAYQHLCALFDADTTALADFVPLECVPAPADNEVHQAAFSRKGKMLYACWCPVSLQEPWEEGSVTLRLPLSETASLTEPILLDPLSGDAFTLPDVQRDNESVTVNKFPLRDYPLLLTDRTIIDN